MLHELDHRPQTVSPSCTPVCADQAVPLLPCHQPRCRVRLPCASRPLYHVCVQASPFGKGEAFLPKLEVLVMTNVNFKGNERKPMLR